MNLVAWLYTTPTAWDSLDLTTLSKDARYAVSNAVTGFHNTLSGDAEVYSVLGTTAQISEILLAFAPTEPTVQAWDYATGAAARFPEWSWRPQETITLPAMPDIVEYDGDGNPISSTPASREAPNYALTFFGEGARQFDGQFDEPFDEDFS